MNNYYYEDTDVPLTSSLLKLIMKRAWIRKYENINRLSLIHAMEFLSPFAMLDLPKDKEERLNNEDDLILKSTLVSISNLRAICQQTKTCVPISSDDFVLMLKRYANLTYVIYSNVSPLFNVLKNQFTHSRKARKTHVARDMRIYSIDHLVTILIIFIG